MRTGHWHGLVDSVVCPLQKASASGKSQSALRRMYDGFPELAAEVASPDWRFRRFETGCAVQETVRRRDLLGALRPTMKTTSTAAMAAIVPVWQLRPSKPLLLLLASLGILAKPASALVFAVSHSTQFGVQVRDPTHVLSSTRCRAVLEVDALCRMLKGDAEALAEALSLSPKHGRTHCTTSLQPISVRLCQRSLSMKVCAAHLRTRQTCETSYACEIIISESARS
eukprot:6207311-Pleurochrysis_carterae.AAC.3